MRHQVHVFKRCHCPSPSKCKDAWYLGFRYKGRRYKESIPSHLDGHNPTTETEAFRAALTIRERLIGETPAESHADSTLAQVIAAFDARVITPSPTAPNTKVSDRAIFKRLAAFSTRRGALGTWAYSDVTEDVLEDFFAGLDADGLAAHTWNKYVTQIVKLCRWAQRKGHGADPLSGESSLLKRRKGTQRHKRVKPALSEKLIAACAGTRLALLITALIETGARVGELLALQWRDVEETSITLAARERGASKTGRRRIPISNVFGAVLEELRYDGVGDPFPPLAYVFSDERGGKPGSIKKAWETAVLKAHGVTPEWTDTHALTPRCRKALGEIDLHVHDLRHEAGHRWLEEKVPLNYIMAFYGHATLTQTSTYLGVDPADLEGAMRAFDARRQESWSQNGPNLVSVGESLRLKRKTGKTLKLVKSGG